MATNHKVTASVSAALPTDSSPHFNDLSIPANATTYRYLMKNCNLVARDAQTSGPAVTPMAISFDLQFTTGFYTGRHIFSTWRQVPWQVTVYLATAIPAYNAWYHACDLELGFNHRQNYGGNGKVASNLRLTWALVVPAGSFSWVGGIQFELDVFYSLP